MAKQVLNIGTTPNDGTGDSLRVGMDKVNDNFTELYNCVSTYIYYVATNGSDNYAGTLAQPFRTWQKGFNTAVAGDTVYIRGGVYAPTNISGTEGVTVENKSGTANKLITISNYPGETPILDCSILAGTGTNTGITLMNCSYWHLKGLSVTGVRQHAQDVFCIGVYVRNGSANILENIKSYNNQAIGFYIRDEKNTSLINCDSYDNYDVSSAGGNADGFEIRNADQTNITTLTGCRAWHNSDDGFDLWLYEGIINFNNCWSIGNGYASGDGNGFKLGETDASALDSVQRTLTNCIATKNSHNGFSQNVGLTKMIFYNNLAYDNSTTGFRFQSAAPEMIFRNNISYHNYEEDYFLANSIHDHNSWDSSITVSDTDFLSLDASSLLSSRKSDGSLPDVSAFHLAQNSALVDAGVDVGLLYYGFKPDIGVFETCGTSNRGNTGVFNVLDYGAKNSSANTQVPIQAAIDAAAVGGVGGKVVIPAGTWNITAPVVLKSYTTVECDKNAYFVMPANYAKSVWCSSTLKLEYAKVTGGTYYCSTPTYYGIDILSPAGAQWVMSNQFKDMYINNASIGINLNILNDGWITLNTFQDIILWGNGRGLKTRESATSGGINGNYFTNVSFENVPGVTQYGIDNLSGDRNQFVNIAFWDYTGASKTCVLDAGSQYNTMIGFGINANNYQNKGNQNFIVSDGVELPWTVDISSGVNHHIFWVKLDQGTAVGGRIDYVLQVTDGSSKIQAKTGSINYVGVNNPAATMAIDASSNTGHFKYVATDASLTLAEAWTSSYYNNNMSIWAQFTTNMINPTMKLWLKLFNGSDKALYHYISHYD